MPRKTPNTSVTTEEQSGSPKTPLVHEGDISVSTKGELDILDITADVKGVIHDSGILEGIACIFVPGATGAITTMEFEPGVVEDVREALQQLAPKNKEYKHHLKWKDGNGHSHVRAAILGPGVTVPIHQGEPCSAPGSSSFS